MTKLAAFRLMLWLGPVLVAYGAAAARRPSRRLLTGVLLAVSWNLWALLAVNLVALHLGWWSFHPSLPTFMGVPLEPWLGWVVLWGAAAPLVGFDRPLVGTAVGFLWLDLIAMPRLEPLVVLDRSWAAGEAAAIALALLPGLFLARWTVAGANLCARAALQVVCAGALMLWLVPSIAVEVAGGWGRALDVPGWQLGVGLQALLVPISLGVRAVTEFVTRGNGTPLPYDSPRKLVTTGPYSYVNNPMQLSMLLCFVIAALVLSNLWMIAAAVVAFAYSAGLAAWHEDEQLIERFGDDWTGYRGRVRSWLPRWRPSVTTASTLLVAYSCGSCSAIGRWLLTRRPIGLHVAPAEDLADPGLRRVTYLAFDGSRSEGVAAIARSLEHIHLGWAVIGWLLALPGIAQLAQLIVDACGPGPQTVAGRPYDRDSCALDTVIATERAPGRQRESMM